MADRFVLTLPHPDLREVREVAVEDVEVDAVDEVVLIVEDAVADVVASIVEDVVADVEVLEVAVAEGKLSSLSRETSNTDLTCSTNRGGFGDFQGKKQTFA
jgi:hypothetical protein